MPEGKFHTISRSPGHRIGLDGLLHLDFFHRKRAAHRKGVRNPALLLFGRKHADIRDGRKRTRLSEHIAASYPVIVRDEDAWFLRVLHVMRNIEKTEKFKEKSVYFSSFLRDVHRT